ncbi:hypothetical protein [Paenibacillus soyae]|uniref:Uncharacterized protein n=1 Tax=Paenibacillus soyae TaxID=2969249 RepID=A0A9X2SCD4_9BACL|nr:hypothetical protein [Paenibacillus soyae]MCR2806648.1 hypothetical protein [Paenibacillus soyae]
MVIKTKRAWWINVLFALLCTFPMYGMLYALVYAFFFIIFLLPLLFGGNIFPVVSERTNELIGLNSLSGWIVLLVLFAIYFLVLEFALVKKYTFTPHGIKFRSNFVNYADIAHVIIYTDRIVIATIMGKELVIKNYKSEQTVIQPIRDGLRSIGLSGKIWRHEPSGNGTLIE